MLPYDVMKLACQELDKWNLSRRGWKPEINSKIARLGECGTHDRIIYISEHHIEHDTDDLILDTIRHEIAHALHYHSYFDTGRKAEFYKRVRRGKRWYRVVPPHGKEWKLFAIMVGANPSAICKKSKVADNVDYTWVTIIKHDNGLLEETPIVRNRFKVDLTDRYMPGRKRETINRLYMVLVQEWEEVKTGLRSPDKLTLYKSNPREWYSKSTVATGCHV